MAQHDADQATPTNTDEDGYRKGFTWGRAAAIIAVVSMVIFWIWIFSGAPAKDNPDRLKDEAYVATLEKRCKALRSDLKELPNAVDLETATERADVLDQANVIVADFVDDLEAGAPTTGDAAKTMEGWIADWRTYLENREDYAKRLRKDPDAQLLLDPSEVGSDSVDKAIEIFTQVNAIPDCATPGDVG